MSVYFNVISSIVLYQIVSHAGLLDKVSVCFNVLSLVMLYWLVSYADRRYIIIVKSHWTISLDLHVF